MKEYTGEVVATVTYQGKSYGDKRLMRAVQCREIMHACASSAVEKAWGAALADSGVTPGKGFGGGDRFTYWQFYENAEMLYAATTICVSFFSDPAVSIETAEAARAAIAPNSDILIRAEPMRFGFIGDYQAIHLLGNLMDVLLVWNLTVAMDREGWLARDCTAVCEEDEYIDTRAVLWVAPNFQKPLTAEQAVEYLHGDGPLRFVCRLTD